MDGRILFGLVAVIVGVNAAYGQECKDKLSQCEKWPNSYCQTYKDYMKETCPKKCGYCSGPVTPTRPTACADKTSSSYCRSWKESGFCATTSQYYQYMKDNCKRTCDLCGSCSASRKLQSCSFNSDTCDFIDVPFDDDLNFVMKSSGGPDGSAYISASGRGEAHMNFPLDLLVPHNGDHGNMCLEFSYRMPSGGSLVVYEVKNEKSYRKTAKLNLSARQSVWRKARLAFHASQRKHLLIVAKPPFGGSIDIDNARFCDGSC